MAMDEAAVVDEIIQVCRRLNDKNMIASADGNVSVRLSDDLIVMTPTGINKAFLKPEDIAMISPDGRVLKGRPSSERLIHLEVYNSCPQAKAVVHAHPPAAIAWSVARPYLKELPSDCLPEVILAVGRIPIVPYARPSTEAMAQNLRPFLCKHRAMILARHGALCWGETLQEAYNGMERVEHAAWILRLAQGFGGLTPVPGEELAALQGMRRKLGERIL